MKKTTSHASKTSPGRSLAKLNTEISALLHEIAEQLDTCGPEATWPQVGTAEHIRAKLGELLATIAPGPRERVIATDDGPVTVVLPEV